MWYTDLGVWFLVLHQAVTSNAAPATTPLQPAVQYTDSEPNDVLWHPSSPIIPQPERAGLGAALLGPQNIPIELQNSDLLAGPTTDNGNVKNFKWSMFTSHTKLKHGGWTKQQNGPCNYFRKYVHWRLTMNAVNAMPIAEDLAGKPVSRDAESNS